MADLKEICAEALLSTTTFTLASTGQTTLYTVPAGKVLILTKAILIAGADASTSVISIGRSTALTDFLGNQTLSNIDAAGDVGLLQPIPNATTALSKSYAAGVVIQINVVTANGGAGNTLMLFGILRNA